MPRASSIDSYLSWNAADLLNRTAKNENYMTLILQEHNTGWQDERIIIVALFEPNLCEHPFIKKPGNYFSLAISIKFYLYHFCFEVSAEKECKKLFWLL